ncbi:fluoride efflux transporter CrcB [Aquibacillus saliphilus]|uniref:fluoride efflux transporter CrcB n=1 Tax=Aquibacillus saliphilus TaxID=1909422 RepID=UPI001CF0C6B9|nr:fluoride efflux transporter CrcB [Aquibacillus saliphilus]
MGLVLVAIGGFFGSIARFTVGIKWNNLETYKPYGTWIANVSGSMLLGIIFVLLEHNLISNWIWLILGAGFCGAYTTFSTFGTEALSMLLAKKYKKALFYILSSLVVSLFIIIIIILIGNTLNLN